MLWNARVTRCRKGKQQRRHRCIPVVLVPYLSVFPGEPSRNETWESRSIGSVTHSHRFASYGSCCPASQVSLFGKKGNSDGKPKAVKRRISLRITSRSDPSIGGELGNRPSKANGSPVPWYSRQLLLSAVTGSAPFTWLLGLLGYE